MKFKPGAFDCFNEVFMELIAIKCEIFLEFLQPFATCNSRSVEAFDLNETFAKNTYCM